MMPDSLDKDSLSMRNMAAFAVMCHTLDLITTKWRSPTLDDEGNPFFQFAVHHGWGGWMALVVTKVIMVSTLGLAYWWYLHVRPKFLPDKIVSTPRALIWYGMWDRRPYPKSMWGRLFNRRKFAFMGFVLCGLAQPAAAAGALFASLDNVCFALGRAIRFELTRPFLLFTVLIVFVWWFWAYWYYYGTLVRSGTITARD
jgi:hypothetical protein